MNHPDFKHRAMPDGGTYEEFSEIDLFTFVDGRINHVQDAIDLISQQFRPDNMGPTMSDSSNLNSLEQIKLDVLDLRVMFEWFLRNHEIVRVEEHHSMDDELPDDERLRTLN